MFISEILIKLFNGSTKVFYIDFTFKQNTNCSILYKNINFKLGKTLRIATDLVKELLRRVLSDA